MQRYAITFLAIMLFLVGITASAVRADEDDDQRALAQRFITAYFTQDIKTVRECLPANDALNFNPYPFTAAPTLAQPRVHENQALVEFTGPVADSKFPGKGGIVVFKHNNVWRVRQVLFYDKVPAIFGLPAKSVTRTDKSFEAKVKAVAEEFIGDWKSNDTKAMLAIWHDWPSRDAERIKGLSMNNFKLSNSTTHWGDPYISYTMTARYKLGPISYSMTFKGGVILVREGNGWKVRGNHFVFDF